MSESPDPLQKGYVCDIAGYWLQPSDDKVRVLELTLRDYVEAYVDALAKIQRYEKEIAQLREQVRDRNDMIATVERENDKLREKNAKLQATIVRVEKTANALEDCGIGWAVNRIRYALSDGGRAND